MKRISLLFAVLVCGMFVTQAFGTAQAPDKIWYEGKLYDMQTNPMEPYFAKNPGMRPNKRNGSSALVRGYLATFEVVNSGLFLRDIEVIAREPKGGGVVYTSVIDEVVPARQKMKIDWFDGLLVLPHGKLVNYVHMGYGSTFENYILLEIAAGNLKRSKSFDHKEYEAFKDRQFAEFKKTEEYRKLFKEMKKDAADWDQKMTDSFIRSFVTNYTAKILVD
ncbi:MAG: hypothetical protein ABL959_21805 [Pyrinomonadaceae bacterium]